MSLPRGCRQRSSSRGEGSLSSLIVCPTPPTAAIACARTTSCASCARSRKLISSRSCTTMRRPGIWRRRARWRRRWRACGCRACGISCAPPGAADATTVFTRAARRSRPATGHRTNRQRPRPRCRAGLLHGHCARGGSPAARSVPAGAGHGRCRFGQVGRARRHERTAAVVGLRTRGQDAGERSRSRSRGARSRRHSQPTRSATRCRCWCPEHGSK